MFKIRLTIYLLFCVLCAQTQPERDYLVKSWDLKDGLIGQNVISVFEDSRQFVWLGTSEGLQRFDGSYFQNFTPSNVRGSLGGLIYIDIMEAKDGTIWLASDGGGLSKYSYDVDSFYTFPVGDGIHELEASRVFHILQDPHDSNIMWLSTIEHGLIRHNVKESTFEKFLIQPVERKEFGALENIVHETTQHPLDPEILILSCMCDAMAFNKKTKVFTRLEPFNGCREPYSWACRSTTFDSENQLWGAYWGNGLVPLSDSNHLVPAHLPHNTSPDKQSGWTNIGLKTERYGHFLLTAFKDVGLTQFNPKTKEFYFFNQHRQKDKRTLPGGCLDFHITNNDRIWVGTQSGLSCINYSSNIFLNEKLTFDDNTLEIYDYLEVDKTQIYTSEHKIIIIDSLGQNYFIHTAYENKHQSIPLGLCDYIFTHQSEIYILTSYSSKNRGSGGLFKLNLSDKKLRRVILESPQKDFKLRIHDIHQDYKHQTWIATRNSGIYNMDSTLKIQHNKATGINFSSQTYISSIHIDSNYIFIAQEEGINKFDIETGQLVKSYDNITGIGDSDMCSDHMGNIWISSSTKGIFRIDLLDDEIKQYNTSTGLLSNKVIRLLPGPEEYLWAFHKTGLTRINVLTDALNTFNELDGLPGSTLYWATPTSNKFIANYFQKGAYILTPPEQINTDPSQVYFRSLSVNGKPIELDSGLFNTPNISLSHDKNFLELEFGITHPLRSKEIDIAYYLEGLEDNWNYSNHRNFASYANLSPGSYTFRIKPTSEKWGQQEKSIKINIQPAFYQRKIFWALLLLSLLAFMVFLYRRRIANIRRQSRKEAEFQKKLSEAEMVALRAQMNPHFIFNSLNSIKYNIISNNIYVAADYLDNFSKLMRLTLNHSKESLIPLSQELESLRLYLEMESVRFEENFNYSIHIQDNIDLERIEIPPLLLQPYVENAIWHGLQHKKEKGSIIIEVCQSGTEHLIKIIDNGIGRVKSNSIKSKSTLKNKSMGMEITKNRMSLHSQIHKTDIKAKIIDLHDQNGHASGTEVIITINEK